MSAKNVIEVFYNGDGTIKSFTNDTIIAGSNDSVLFRIVAPFNTIEVLELSLLLPSGILTDKRPFQLTDETIEVEGDLWNVWEKPFSQAELQGASIKNGAETIAYPTVTEFFDNDTIYSFVGQFTSGATLNALIGGVGGSLTTDYAGVGLDLERGDLQAWQYVGNPTYDFVYQGQTIEQFETEKDIVINENIKPLIGQPIYVNAHATSAGQEQLDFTVTDITNKRLSDVETSVVNWNSTIGTNGEYKVSTDLPYSSITEPNADDELYLNRVGDLSGKIKISDLTLATQETRVGTFDTANDTGTPTTDLIKAYPQPIVTSSDRQGWVANVIATNSKWAWSVPDNQWFDTLEVPLNDINVAATNTDNTLTGLNVKENIDQLDGRLVTVEEIIDELDVGGVPDNTAHRLDITTNPHNVTTTHLSLENVDNTSDADKPISDDTQIALDLKLDKTGGTITSDLVINGDLTVSGTTTLVDTTDMAIKDNIIILNDGETGVGVSSGSSGIEIDRGTETNAILYFDETTDTFKAGIIGSEIEVGGITHSTGDGSDHADVASNTAAIPGKEDSSNKTDSIAGNETSSIFYPSTKGVYDYVKDPFIQAQQDREYSTFVQVPDTPKFKANLNDTALTNGKILFAEIDSITVQSGIVQFSIDGGTTFKNMRIYDATQELYINFDLGIEVIAGLYFDLVFNTSLDSWILARTDQDIYLLAGAGYTADLSIKGNYDDNQQQDTRLDNLEGGTLGGKSTVLQTVSLSTPLTLSTTTDTLFKIDFDTILNPSNEIEVINVDVDNDAILVFDEDPGYRPSINARIVNNGAPTSTSQITLYLFDKNGTISIGNELDIITLTAINQGISADRSKVAFLTPALIKSLTGFPFTTAVYYTNDTANPTDLTINEYSQESLFSSLGVTTTANTTIFSPTTETPDGNKVSQADANIEFTTDLKSLDGSSRLIPLTYVSSGKFKANTDIVFDELKSVRVQFPSMTTDLNDAVTISLDDEENYYPLTLINTDILAVEDIQNRRLEVFKSGTRIMTDDIEIDIAPLQYTTSEVIDYFPDNITGNVYDDEVESLTVNGNGTTSVISDNNITRIGIKSDGTWQLVTAYQSANQIHSLIAGNKYFAYYKAKDSSIGDFQNRVLVRYDDESTDVFGVATNGFIEVGKILTPTETKNANINIYEGNAGLIERDYQLFIPLTNTSLENKSEAELIEIAQQGYFEGKSSLGVYDKAIMDNWTIEGNILENEIVNGDFSDGTTGWNGHGSTIYMDGDDLVIDGDGTNTRVYLQYSDNSFYKDDGIAKYFTYTAATFENELPTGTSIVFRTAPSGTVQGLTSTFIPTILNDKIEIYGIVDVDTSNIVVSTSRFSIQSIYADTTEAGNAIIKINKNDGIFAIKLTGTILENATESHLLALVREGYFEDHKFTSGNMIIESPNMFDYNGLESGDLDASGIEGINNDVYRTKVENTITVTESIDYIFKMVSTTNLSSISANYYIDGVWDSVITITNDTSFTIPATINGLRFELAYTSGNKPSMENANAQLQLGITSTNFANYSTQKITQALPELRKLGTSIDTLDNNGIITRNVAKIEGHNSTAIPSDGLTGGVWKAFNVTYEDGIIGTDLITLTLPVTLWYETDPATHIPTTETIEDILQIPVQPNWQISYDGVPPSKLSGEIPSSLKDVVLSNQSTIVNLEKQVDDNRDDIVTKIGDAPSDGSEYVRKDAAWVTSAGGDFKADGTVPMTGDLDIATNDINNTRGLYSTTSVGTGFPHIDFTGAITTSGINIVSGTTGNVYIKTGTITQLEIDSTSIKPKNTINLGAAQSIVQATTITGGTTTSASLPAIQFEDTTTSSNTNVRSGHSGILYLDTGSINRLAISTTDILAEASYVPANAQSLVTKAYVGNGRTKVVSVASGSLAYITSGSASIQLATTGPSFVAGDIVEIEFSNDSTRTSGTHIHSIVKAVLTSADTTPIDEGQKIQVRTEISNTTKKDYSVGLAYDGTSLYFSYPFVTTLTYTGPTITNDHTADVYVGNVWYLGNVTD